jgi:hypothetical protein
MADSQSDGEGDSYQLVLHRGGLACHGKRMKLMAPDPARASH